MTTTTHAPAGTGLFDHVAAPEDAVRHFRARLGFETDVSDVAAALASPDAGFVLVDTRSEAAWAAGRIPGAVHLPGRRIAEEAARVVRIGRSAAYKLAREYLATNGASGLPAKRIGGQLRAPRHLLEAFVGGPITWPIPDAPTDDSAAEDLHAATAEPFTLADPIQVTRRRATRRNGSQIALTLDG